MVYIQSPKEAALIKRNMIRGGIVVLEELIEAAGLAAQLTHLTAEDVLTIAKGVLKELEEQLKEGPSDGV